ncbi:MAG: lipo-like protein [Gammaproteobacteria bacterium]|nr:lipo-like protein [Gammaproteobacteria bacterium]
MINRVRAAIGRRLAAYLSKSLPGYQRFDAVPLEGIASVIRPGDILLVEGDSRISVAIQYLTQSSWSHACLHVGAGGDAPDLPVLLEADLQSGVHLVPLEKYQHSNLRICRPVGLTDEEISSVITFARGKLGHQYDLKNIFDLVRFLIQRPAVPNRYRRTMLALGSGDPTRAICSTLIAQSFQFIDYPILPRFGYEGDDGEVPTFYKAHFTHYTPRDFDVSPYFCIIKPTIEQGFNYRTLQWTTPEADTADT